MQSCDREGSFRAHIVEYGLKEMDSGAVAVSLRAQLLDWYNGQEWEAWAQFDMEAEGDVWIVKKDNGGINQIAVESLIKFAGWDGTIESIVNQTWTPTPCQVAVKRDEYKGTTRFKVSFINDYDRTPGSLSNVTPDKSRELVAKFGPQLRAIAGNAKRNGATPAGKPPTPAPPPRPAAPPRQGVPAGHDSEGTIPF